MLELHNGNNTIYTQNVYSLRFTLTGCLATLVVLYREKVKGRIPHVEGRMNCRTLNCVCNISKSKHLCFVTPVPYNVVAFCFPSLSLLVKSVKSKTGQFHEQKKKKKVKHA